MSFLDKPPGISKTILIAAAIAVRQAIEHDDAEGRRLLHDGLFDGYCLSCFEAKPKDGRPCPCERDE